VIYKVFLRKSHKKAYIEALADFLIDELRLRSSRYNLAITPAPKFSTDGGWVVHTDREIVMFLNPNQTPYELGHTIAHEFVHVKQIASGLLRFEPPMVKWRGGVFCRYNKSAYLKRPWEIQALQQQAILLRKFELHCTSSKKRVTIT